MALGFSTSSPHTFLASLHSSFPGIFPVWVSWALLLYWCLWSQRKHFHTKVLETGRIWVCRKDSCSYRTERLHSGDSSFLKFPSGFFSGKNDPFRYQGHCEVGKAEATPSWVSWGFTKSLLSCRRLQNLVQRHIFSLTFSGIILGKLLANEESRDGAPRRGWWCPRTAPDEAVICRGKVFIVHVRSSMWLTGQLFGGPWY